MNREIEIEIIKKFVRKNKQERIIWELGNSRKRREVFWHFAGVGILKKECIRKTEEMPGNIIGTISYPLNKEVYFIGSDYIGEMRLKDAIAKAEQGAICIIYYGNGKGYYQGEEELGDRQRCFLISCE